jgi:RAP1 GTPase activating protein 1
LQIERKKHIGNDVVVIVFLERGAEPFNPFELKSHFNRNYYLLFFFPLCYSLRLNFFPKKDIFCCVQIERKTGQIVDYRVTFASKPGVPPYGPFLPYPNIIRTDTQSREFLLTKRISISLISYLFPFFLIFFSKLTPTKLSTLNVLQ